MMSRSHVVSCAAAFVAALLIALACTKRYPTTAFRCWPGGPEPRCPDLGGYEYQCCSDDPAALELTDLAGPTLPDYGSEPTMGTGTPLFAGERNNLSHSGMCVKIGAVSPAFALPTAGAAGCPIPCNPSWDQPSIDIICGEGQFCCQTTEVHEADCVLDPGLGDDGCWRPARGEDIFGLGGIEATSWSSEDHLTHQDPGGRGCEDFVAGLSQAQLDAAGVNADEVLLACCRRLGAADQRGYCLGGPGVAGCPLAQPSYRDACEKINDAEGRAGCP